MGYDNLLADSRLARAHVQAISIGRRKSTVRHSLPRASSFVHINSTALDATTDLDLKVVSTVHLSKLRFVISLAFPKSKHQQYILRFHSVSDVLVREQK